MLKGVKQILDLSTHPHTRFILISLVHFFPSWAYAQAGIQNPEVTKEFMLFHTVFNIQIRNQMATAGVPGGLKESLPQPNVVSL